MISDPSFYFAIKTAVHIVIKPKSKIILFIYLLLLKPKSKMRSKTKMKKHFSIKLPEISTIF